MQTITKLNTSPEHYLTARTALNIDSAEMTGDWNFHNYFSSIPHEYYVERAKNTPWGKKGIIEVSNVLSKFDVHSDNPNSKQIYAADHYRALADLFFDGIKENNPLRSLFYDIDDYLNTEEQKNNLFNDYLQDLKNPEICAWNENRAKY